ncbi:EXTL2, alpha-1,4-N-acetylhexosaminyltransferase, partial [Oesophagostomum dentatum]
VLLTYNRDAVLAASLERLHRLPYLNKVIVIWNNVDREPLGAWPRLHVPVEFIKVARNSLNNRFVPWDRITTEAVLSLDDDIDLKQHEIIFAFRNSSLHCRFTIYFQFHPLDHLPTYPLDRFSAAITNVILRQWLVFHSLTIVDKEFTQFHHGINTSVAVQGNNSLDLYDYLDLSIN